MLRELSPSAAGYHIAWIPERGAAGKRHLFDGVEEAGAGYHFSTMLLLQWS